MSDPTKLLTLRQCDRVYRRRKGTAGAAWRAGRLRGRQVGNRVYVSAKGADELFGVDGVTL
jgi:hypothetical protein